MDIKLNSRFSSLSVLLLLAILLSSCGQKSQQTTAPPQPPPAASSPISAPPPASAPPAMVSSSADSLQPSAEDLKLGVLPQGTTCPAKDPVKAKITKKRGKIYHLPKSPNYDQVKADICFPDATTAEKAGFRVPR